MDDIFDLDNTLREKKDPAQIKIEYDFIKSLIPIYVFHRSQGCNEKEAFKNASREMVMILKLMIKNYTKPDG